MNRYQRTHDGLVIVEGAGGLYIDTAENFAADAGAAAPGAPGLLLSPGKIECVIDAEGNQRGSDLNAIDRAHCVQWVDAVALLLAARDARLAAFREAAAAAMSIDEKRRAEYAKRGVTVDAMNVALWEKLVEGRPESADALQAVRLQVKAELPK